MLGGTQGAKGDLNTTQESRFLSQPQKGFESMTEEFSKTQYVY